MKKTLFAIATLLCTSALALDTRPSSDNNSASSNNGSNATFTPKQQEEIGKIASDYLVQHPETLIDAGKALQQKQMQEMQTKMVSAVLANQSQLLNDPNTPALKPDGAKVAVIEFFDYQCAFCHKVLPTVEQLMKANPNVMFVFKEFPIFSQRWEASKYAAAMGYAVYKLNGEKAYSTYHHEIFSSGKMEGNLTTQDVDNFATKAGVDLGKAKDLVKKDSTIVDNNLRFGIEKLGFEFTPVFVVMPLQGANKDNTTVIPGFTNLSTLQAAISKAQATGANPESTPTTETPSNVTPNSPDTQNQSQD